MTTAQDFIDRYDSQIFNRSDELLKGLRDGSIHLESTSLESRQLSSAYLDIYQFRLERLKQKPSSDHARAMAADVGDLCIHLEEHPESPIDLWIFSQSPHFSYSVFVTRELHLVAGCIRGIDARQISESALTELCGRHSSPDESTSD